MESQSPQSSSPSIVTSTFGEDEDAFDDSEIQTRLSRNDSVENNVISSNESEATIPSSLSSTSSTCTDTSSRLQRGRRRRRTEHSNQVQPLEMQLQQDPHRQRQLAEEEEEPDVFQPATNTTMSQKSLFVLRPIHRYVDLVCIGLSVLAHLLETTMNAALAIFGIGVGVGLVLGDSFRATLPLLPSVQASQQQQHTHQTTTPPNTTAEDTALNEFIALRSVSNLLPAQ